MCTFGWIMAVVIGFAALGFGALWFLAKANGMK